MTLIPENENHLLQIQAGVIGRKKGHNFEEFISEKINKIKNISSFTKADNDIYYGNAAENLLKLIIFKENIQSFDKVTAICTGILATSELKSKGITINGVPISKSKSDVIISFFDNNRVVNRVGVSTKQCNNKTPTNAQLYFTTAIGFSNLLRTHGLEISENAENSLRQFCGDIGFRPLDTKIPERKTDNRRYFWEEILTEGKIFWENLFEKKQNTISEILFKFAYDNDKFPPNYLIHKTKYSENLNNVECAIYKIDDLISKSVTYRGFEKKLYRVTKGSFKDPIGIFHEAPRFGIIQMQRGGQKQHPTQLQFNLEAGYFYKI